MDHDEGSDQVVRLVELLLQTRFVHLHNAARVLLVLRLDLAQLGHLIGGGIESVQDLTDLLETWTLLWLEV